ncbi:uncharacterized protein TRIADDRAFT_54593 [Trichoplax adhaerens]|uniref:Calponin-homology (CH) domain-containing protein n=1 Tax=Trichoplax adhaerens TaxID=10228 RepID=B3RSH0_TRIAD|nr:hypothetical protein TRIADDRAFT_54593 [Trichoplax adhaerens]EDV27055.1 hypothetical protein TRIADDRAFT_54593 [Trichoplax adhaerens]|eukprot:XP_002111051.1 hypothetical protein TRIADDRAFT_54593 [Trichoplax adhaerens]
MAQFQGNTGDTFKRNTNFTRSQRPRTIDKQEQKKIYVGWANTYLAQREFPELINDLQKDINKGLILINLMESIVGERIPHVCRNPYYQNQKLANVINCLKYLNKKGIAIHYGIATDIVNGDLKAILSLFFSLTQLEHQIKLQKSKQKAINDNDEQRMASNSYNSLSLRRAYIKDVYILYKKNLISTLYDANPNQFK